MSAMNTVSTPAASASAATATATANLQSHGASNRSTNNRYRMVNKLPSLVDQRWPHPDRRVPLPPLSTTTSNAAAAAATTSSNNNKNDQAKASISAPTSIDVLKAAAEIAMGKSTATATTTATGLASSRLSSSPDDDDDDDHHHHHSGNNSKNNNNNNITTALAITTTSHDNDDSNFTALPSMSFKPAPPVLLPSASSPSSSPSSPIISPGNNFRLRLRSRFRSCSPSLSCLPPFTARLPLFARPEQKGGKEMEEETAASPVTAEVEPVRLWTAGQLARARHGRLADAMAAEILRLNAEVRRLEGIVGVEAPRGRVGVGIGDVGVGVRESWVTVDDEWEEE